MVGCQARSGGLLRLLYVIGREEGAGFGVQNKAWERCGHALMVVNKPSKRRGSLSGP